jgi:hypothetical protein
VTEYAVGAPTLKTADFALLAPAPLPQVSVKVTDPTVEGVTAVVPLNDSVPVHPSLAVQLLVFVDVQLNVALCPRTILLGETENEMLGGGAAALLPYPPPPPPHPASNAAIRNVSEAVLTP